MPVRRGRGQGQYWIDPELEITDRQAPERPQASSLLGQELLVP